MDFDLTLEDLFDKWQKAHEDDKNFNNNCTLSEDAKKNFVLDGRFDEAKTGGILFICKESNVECDIEYGEKEFWMKNVVDAKSKGEYFNPLTTNDKCAQTKYYNCLCLIIKDINNKTGNSYKIEDCAYMNINKRGGKGVADNVKIKNYFNNYCDLIKKEIMLLNCDYIVVFCYESLNYIVDELKNIEGCSDKIYGYAKHPSRYSKKCLSEKL